MVKTNAKIALFTILIAMMAMPVSASNTAFAEYTVQEADKLTKYQKDLAELKQKTLRENKIPDLELVDRYGQKWEEQFSSKKEFKEIMFAHKAYATSNLQNNGWNQAMISSHIQIHNFDTIIEKTGFAHEIVSLVVAKQKLQGQYNESKPVQKFHDWISAKYSAPDTMKKIDQRLDEIISESKFTKFATDLTKTFNTLASHGNVPKDLFDSDLNYWNAVLNMSLCKYQYDCNVSDLQAILDTKAYDKVPNDIPQVASSWLDLVFKRAYAWSPAPHFTAVYGEPYTCTYNTCKETKSMGGYGEHNLTAEPPNMGGSHGKGHGTSKYMEIYGSSCSAESNYNSVILTGTIGSTQKFQAAQSGYFCATITQTFQASAHSQPYYVWYANVITNAWSP